MIAFLGVAIVVCIVQECVNSAAYKKWKQDKIENYRR